MASSQESVVLLPVRSKRHTFFWTLLAMAWLGAALAGLYVLAQYANTPGAAAEIPAQWPTDSSIPLSPAGDTLVMFVHPKCPCSRASMSELQRTIAHIHEPITTWVVFYRPATMAPGWEQTDLWHSAIAIPGTHVISDVDGVEAARFHATTSGQTVLYDANGHLLFSGGITGQRGHEGDNAGETAIKDLVNSSSSECRETSVFGCPISTPKSSQ
jgi:hypothetical protein